MSEDAHNPENGIDRTPSLEELQCRGDFWQMMKEAIVESGGDPEAWAWEELDMGTFVNVYAARGLRIVRIPEKSVDHATDPCFTARHEN